jgi:GNAT superfamily N-acetyltransferase
MTTAWTTRRLRAATDDLAKVRPYVLATWARSSRSQRLEHDPKTAARLLDGATEVWLAEDPEEPGVVVGWCLVSPSSPPVLHYVYVRSIARGHGCATALLAAAQVARGELLTSQTGRIPRPVVDWYDRVTRIDPRLAFA